MSNSAGRPHKKGRNGNKKHGRNKAFCTRYKLENREAKNKARNIKREMKKQNSPFAGIVHGLQELKKDR
jgi:hypothetical protein